MSLTIGFYRWTSLSSFITNFGTNESSVLTPRDTSIITPLRILNLSLDCFLLYFVGNWSKDKLDKTSENQEARSDLEVGVEKVS